MMIQKLIDEIKTGEDEEQEAGQDAYARAIFEHIAIQFNIKGEGAGIFYIEVADRNVCVEPYDYYDKDALVEIASEALIGLSDGTMTLEEVMEKGLTKEYGNIEKLKKLHKIVFKRDIFW